MNGIHPDPKVILAIREEIRRDRRARLRFRALVSSIERHDVRLHLVVDSDGCLLDGFHRYLACELLGIRPPVLRLDRAEALRLVLYPGHERSRPIRFNHCP